MGKQCAIRAVAGWAGVTSRDRDAGNPTDLGGQGDEDHDELTMGRELVRDPGNRSVSRRLQRGTEES